MATWLYHVPSCKHYFIHVLQIKFNNEFWIFKMAANFFTVQTVMVYEFNLSS